MNLPDAKRHARESRQILLTGIIALLLWLLVFGSGALVGSARFRYPMSAGQDILENFFPALLFFTPTNGAILSALAGLLGGCAGSFQIRRQPGIDPDAPSNRSELYRLEDPWVSMFRGFVLYLIYLSGIMLTTGTDFNVALRPNEDDIQKNLDGTIEYVRFAGFVSLLAFVIGYDQSIFEKMLGVLPIVGQPATASGKSVPPPDNGATPASRKKGDTPGKTVPKAPLASNAPAAGAMSQADLTKPASS